MPYPTISRTSTMTDVGWPFSYASREWLHCIPLVSVGCSVWISIHNFLPFPICFVTSHNANPFCVPNPYILSMCRIWPLQATSCCVLFLHFLTAHCNLVSCRIPYLFLLAVVWLQLCCTLCGRIASYSFSRVSMHYCIAFLLFMKINCIQPCTPMAALLRSGSSAWYTAHLILKLDVQSCCAPALVHDMSHPPLHFGVLRYFVPVLRDLSYFTLVHSEIVGHLSAWQLEIQHIAFLLFYVPHQASSNASDLSWWKPSSTHCIYLDNCEESQSENCSRGRKPTYLLQLLLLH